MCWLESRVKEADWKMDGNYFYPVNTYACYSSDTDKRIKSSSGAVFSALAEYALEKNGIVYGVAMTDDCYSAELIEVTDESDLAKLRGSKYLQVKIGDTYNKVKENLQAGKLVLFSGTGCQINGLKKFLGAEYENLICVDVICHGTPSSKLWQKYVEHEELKTGGKLKTVNFRCKDDSWINFGMCEIFEIQGQGVAIEVYTSKDNDSYMQMFLRDYCLRPSCYKCSAKENKMSDISIADFWGIDSVAAEMNDGLGTSLVLTRTKKGQDIFDDIKTCLKIKTVTYEEGVRNNSSEYKSCDMPLQRKTFFTDMNRMSFEQLEAKYLGSHFYRLAYAAGRRVLKTKVKEVCYGCTACYAVCPKKAIAMVEDEEGFLYPQIDKRKCIHCNSCIKVCQMQSCYLSDVVGVTDK